MAGMSLLLNPAHSLVLGLILVTLWMMSRISLTQFAISGSVAVLIIAPWIIRNNVEVGYPTFIRSNIGYEIHRWLATDPLDTKKVGASNPGRNPTQLALYRELGERRYMAHQTLLARDLFLNDPSFVMRRICYPHDRFLGRQRRSRLASALVWRTNTCKTVIQARIQSRAFRDTFLDRSFRYAPASSRKRRPYRSRDNYDRHYRIPYSLSCRPHDATLQAANRAISCLG